MQAPTTPGGPSAQEPDQRACVGCGAANGLAAAFCWRCHRPFGAQAAAPGLAGAPSGSPVRPDAPYAGPATWAPSRDRFEAPGPSRGLGRVAVVALLAVGLIGGAYWFVSRPDPVAMPERFGGMSRIEDAQTRIVAQTFRSQVEDSGIEGDLALFGDGWPTAALMWIRDASVPTTDTAFDAFASGFDSGIGQEASLDRSRRSNETVGGVTYVCAPVVGGTPGTICMWEDDGVFWLLFEFSGQGQMAARSLAVVAHDAVETA